MRPLDYHTTPRMTRLNGYGSKQGYLKHPKALLVRGNRFPKTSFLHPIHSQMSVVPPRTVPGSHLSGRSSLLWSRWLWTVRASRGRKVERKLRKNGFKVACFLSTCIYLQYDNGRVTSCKLGKKLALERFDPHLIGKCTANTAKVLRKQRKMSWWASKSIGVLGGVFLESVLQKQNVSLPMEHIFKHTLHTRCSFLKAAHSKAPPKGPLKWKALHGQAWQIC